MASDQLVQLFLGTLALIPLANGQSCSSEGALRLMDATSPSSASTRFAGGRLEVCEGARWLSPVRSGFTMAEAHVVCTQLHSGTAFAAAIVNGTNFVATSNDLSDRVYDCLGTEPALSSCTSTTTPVDTASTSVGVVCNQSPSSGDIRLVGGTSTQRGRVQLFVSGQWQNLFTGPSDWTTLVADLVCKQLGFRSGLRGFTNDYDSSVDTGPPAYRIANLQCPLTEFSSFGNCSYDVSPSNSNPAIVQCTPNGEVDGTVRLLDSSGTPTTGVMAGIAEMSIGSRWGPLCYNLMSIGGNEEEALCNRLGYNGGGVASPRALRSTSNRPIWFDTLSCSGNENGLLPCDITTLGLPRTAQCSHDHLLYISCLSAVDASSVSTLAVHPGGITAIIVVGLVTFGFLFPFAAGLFLDIWKGNRSCENCNFSMSRLTAAVRRTTQGISSSLPSRANQSSAYATEISEVPASGVSRREIEGEGEEEEVHENAELTAQAPPSYNEAEKYLKEEEEEVVEDLPPAYKVNPDLPPYPVMTDEADPPYPPAIPSDPAYPPLPMPSTPPPIDNEV